MNSSHIPDSYGLGQAVDISSTTSKYRYELVQVVQKFFNRIGISGGSYGGFVHFKRAVEFQMLKAKGKL